MSPSQVIKVRGLRKDYDGRAVVDGVDLDVGPGEIVGLIGANGAGKTTTVECIQGLRRPDAGTLSVLGLDPVTQRDQLRPLIGSQLQSAALPDRLRVDEAVRLFGGREGEELLEQFGLVRRRKAAFASLSGGERQRLFLVLALLHRPRLVILDELTQGLDPTARRNVWSAVDQLRHDGASVLLVTHELDDAERLCDRVLAMRSGRILDSGSPSELVDRHSRSATIAFTLPISLPLADRPVDPVDFAALPGVTAVHRAGPRLTVSGNRAAIAHVSAALIGAGPVPADLSVRVPTLEEALVGLLERPESPAQGARR